jgi:hypothetical protein
MKTIAYCSPFVPPEWIAAHGLRPHWLRLSAATGRMATAVGRGICPYAGALIDAALAGLGAAALVLSTTCDQMRYAAAMVETRGGHDRPAGALDAHGHEAHAAEDRCPVFLLNVPSMWETAAVRELYRSELRRLGRFLTGLGGSAPADAELAGLMLDYERARRNVYEAAASLSGRQFAEALAELHGAPFDVLNNRGLTAPGKTVRNSAAVPLAMLGGPLLEPDYELFDLVERSGGRVVLDATEGGERTMPRRFDPARIAADPLAELADAYFDGIADVFRRPNTGFYEWLGCQLSARSVRGIIFRRFAWCDLWHAELQRVRQWTRLPVLDIDAGPDDTAAARRTEGRIEAFLEMLA